MTKEQRRARWRGWRWGILLVLTLGCVGCAGSISEDFPKPKYQIRGATPNDQDWIDKTVAAEQKHFAFPPPAARPELLEPVPPAPRRAKPKAKPTATADPNVWPAR